MNDSVHTVFFDFDGTLVFHEPDSFTILSAFCADIGQPLSKERERLGRQTRHQYFVDPIIREHRNGMTVDQFWHHFNRHMLEALDIEGDLDELADQVQDRFADVQLTYYCPSAGCHTLEELKARGYALGLITNRENPDRFYELLDEMALRSYFDSTLASGEVGIHKPEPGIFHAALERLGVSAEGSVYVGDNYWADVVGARRAGVMPVLFDPDHLFPDVDCLILERIDGLLEWLP